MLSLFSSKPAPLSIRQLASHVPRLAGHVLVVRPAHCLRTSRGSDSDPSAGRRHLGNCHLFVRLGSVHEAWVAMRTRGLGGVAPERLRIPTAFCMSQREREDLGGCPPKPPVFSAPNRPYFRLPTAHIFGSQPPVFSAPNRPYFRLQASAPNAFWRPDQPVLGLHDLVANEAGSWTASTGFAGEKFRDVSLAFLFFGNHEVVPLLQNRAECCHAAK